MTALHSVPQLSTGSALGISEVHSPPQRVPRLIPTQPLDGDTGAGSLRAAEPSVIYFCAGEAKFKRPRKSR